MARFTAQRSASSSLITTAEDLFEGQEGKKFTVYWIDT